MEGDELKRIHDCINDAWKFVKTYGQPDGSDDFWERLTQEVENLVELHNEEFMDELLLLCVYDIEQRYNRSVGEGVILEPGRQLDNLYSRLRKKYAKGA